jgi:glycopeptide antibiotics resistance protein
MMGVPFFMFASTLRGRLWFLAILSLLIVSLELAQLGIPSRCCDIWDMFWGCLGLLAAWAVVEAFKRFTLTISLKSNPAT